MNQMSKAHNPNFPKTRWSLVMAASGNDPKQKQLALAEICRQYWYPLYAYVRRRGLSAEDAQDLTQGFFEHLLEGKTIEQIRSAEFGKLRSFLLASIQNWMTKQHHKQTSAKRGGGKVFSIDSLSAEERYLLEPSHSDDPERLYERRWAMMILDSAISRLRSSYESAGKAQLADLLIPLLSRGEANLSMRDLALSAGVSEGYVRVLLHRIRKHFRASLIEMISETVGADAEVTEELRHLQMILMT
jgi:RNA polymerase sigma-70 factor (ECF subfamily)